MQNQRLAAQPLAAHQPPAQPQPLRINPQAIFVADAHFLPGDERFFALLEAIKRLPAGTQVIFLGDIFAALFGGVKSSESAYAAEICALENCEQDIIIFEGNHDFNLRRVFKRKRVIDAIFCPAVLDAQNGAQNGRQIEIFIQHGDVFLPPLTQFALKILRAKWFLFAANLLDFRGWIFGRILRAQERKEIYKELKNFKNITCKRVAKMQQHAEKLGQARARLIIEGHFHQGKSYEIAGAKYINLPAFAHKSALFCLDSELNLREFTFNL